MSISPSLDSADIIPSALKLFSRNRSRSAPVENPVSRPPAQDQKHQRAMAQRLEQLSAALGEDKTSQTTPLAAPIAHENRGTHGTAALLLTGILSALLGAGMMWMATPSASGDPVEAATPAQTVTMSPLSTAAEAPATSAAPKPEMSDEQTIGTLLENWRNAWTQRDAASYLNAYSKDFVPADGSPREAWVVSRQKKLSAATSIDVQVSNLAIERIDDQSFKATFLQDYTSGSYREKSRAKTLLIAREDGGWRITREWLEK